MYWRSKEDINLGKEANLDKDCSITGKIRIIKAMILLIVLYDSEKNALVYNKRKNKEAL